MGNERYIYIFLSIEQGDKSGSLETGIESLSPINRYYYVVIKNPIGRLFRAIENVALERCSFVRCVRGGSESSRCPAFYEFSRMRYSRFESSNLWSRVWWRAANEINGAKVFFGLAKSFRPAAARMQMQRTLARPFLLLPTLSNLLSSSIISKTNFPSQFSFSDFLILSLEDSDCGKRFRGRKHWPIDEV